MTTSSAKISLAIFASGAGSNAVRIMEHFENHPFIQIGLVVYSRKEAGIKEKTAAFDVPAVYWNDKSMQDKDLTLAMLDFYMVSGIVLAGYLSLIPTYLIHRFQGKILNIHPSLLPEYGGKGMYGIYIHEAVSKSGIGQTGLTIHVVNDKYDKGRIIFQHLVPIRPHEDPKVIQEKVLKMEHRYYSGVIEQYFKSFYK